jgi:serine/threonine-protein phosphatase CPPED1
MGEKDATKVVNDKSQIERFAAAQQQRTLRHPVLCQQETTTASTAIAAASHTFVVAADTQLGMLRHSLNMDAEIAYSKAAVSAINKLRPAFCCVCGDLVEMTASLYTPGKAKDPAKDPNDCWTEEECDQVQTQQDEAFQSIWSQLDPSIALVCLCGNHDVGNRPTKATIDRFKSNYGDDYLSFWANGTFNIILNSNLFSDPAGALDLYQEQVDWLRQRLAYAQQHQAKCIFVFSHHPWFLYNDDETELTTFSPCPVEEWGKEEIPDNYFPIPLRYRRVALDLFRRYEVDAAFSGHFHQNVVSKSSFGMHMIITSSLSVVLDSNGNVHTIEPKGQQGFRLVTVQHDLVGNGRSTFSHEFIPLSGCD